MVNQKDERFVLLMRHPSKRWKWEEGAVFADLGLPHMINENLPYSDTEWAPRASDLKTLKKESAQELWPAATRVAEAVCDDTSIRVGKFVYAAESPEARLTCALVQLAIGTNQPNPHIVEKPEEWAELNPYRVSAYRPNAAQGELEEAQRQLGKALQELPHGTNAIVVTGHAPAIALLAQKHSNWWRKRLNRPHDGIALAHSEVACIKGTVPRPKNRESEEGNSGLAPTSSGATDMRFVPKSVLWTVAPSDPDASKALLGKVQTKMTVAGVAGSVTVAVLAVVIQGLASRTKPNPTLTSFTAASLAVLFAAAWLFLAGVFFSTGW
jgi:hypothetical protein